MKSLKILLLSSIFVFTNCSIINDKIFSPRSEKNQNDKSDEKETVTVKERIYIEDDKKKEKVQIQEGLQGDTDFEDNNIWNKKSEVKRWVGKYNIFGLYKHEYYNNKEDFQFKVGVGVQL